MKPARSATLILALSACAAEDPPSGTLRVLSYNVHGLPPPITGDDTHARVTQIATRLDGYDLVGLQEDWDAADHAALTADLPSPVQWFSDTLQGRVYGAGLTLSSTTTQVTYREQHYGTCAGFLDGASDCFASKGFQVLSLTLGESWRVDVYNTHLEAGGGPEDDAARAAQVDQLITSVEATDRGIGVLLMGDTNLDIEDPEDAIELEKLSAIGLIDACEAEGCPDPTAIDRVMLRNGDVQLRPAAWGFEAWTDDAGAPLSDHDPLVVEVGWGPPLRR